MWRELQADPRALARLLHYIVPGGPDGKLLRAAAQGRGRVGTKGADLRTFALIALWRTAFYPDTTTLVVVPTLAHAQIFFAVTGAMVAGADREVQNRVRIEPKRGIAEAGASRMSCVWTTSGCLGAALPAGPLTVLVPNVDLVCGPHLRYAAALANRSETFVALNCRTCGILG